MENKQLMPAWVGWKIDPWITNSWKQARPSALKYTAVKIFCQLHRPAVRVMQSISPSLYQWLYIDDRGDVRAASQASRLHVNPPDLGSQTLRLPIMAGYLGTNKLWIGSLLTVDKYVRSLLGSTNPVALLWAHEIGRKVRARREVLSVKVLSGVDAGTRRGRIGFIITPQDPDSAVR